MYIGKRVKELRTQQDMTLTALAKASGVQIATLSRIEHLKMVGTLEVHYQIAKALSVDITQLYNNITTREEKAKIGIPNASTDVFVHSDKSSYEILTTQVMSKRMMPILLKIDAEGRTNKEQFARGSERFLYVLQGNVTVNVGKETFTLGRHHTLYFDATEPHCIINNTKNVAKVLSVTTPVML